MSDFNPDKLRTGGALDIYAQNSNVQEEDDRLIGRRLGDYTIETLIAAGGMARVYRATRVDGAFERDVAIKVSPGSSLNPELRQRFTREQAVLASLEHPNIARLFDAGLTEESWPYIVMELVDGQPIDQYCRAHELDQRQVVTLGMKIADALAFAHTRLVAHCDLKPSNLLVTGDGRPVLLDFGIAKLLDADSEQTSTRRPLSPKYASPEQLLGQEITTASDIYQLGALLFQLLVGHPVVEDESLSEVIGNASRGAELADVTHDLKALPKDLAQILAVSLRRDPAQRYRDASAMQSDLYNYLNHYPVTAVGSSLGYRLRSFMRRNRAMVAVSTLATFVVLVGSVVYAVTLTQARSEAEREKQLAEESLNFLLGFFDDVKPKQARDHDVTAREVIDKGVSRLRTELAEKPEVQAKLMLALSTLYSDFGEHELARQLAEDARAFYLTEYGETYPESRQAASNLARALFLKADYAGAAELYARLVSIDEQLHGPVHEHTLASRSNLAAVYWYMGRREEAVEETRLIFDLSTEVLGERHEMTITRAGNYAISLQSIGRIEESLPILDTHLALARREFGESHPLTLTTQNYLAVGLMRHGDLEQAQTLWEELLGLSTKVRGADHPETMNTVNNLAALYYETNKIQQAVDLQTDLIPRMTRVQGADHPRVLATQSQLAFGITKLGDAERGLDMVDKVIEQQTQTLGGEHLDTLNARINKASILVMSNDPGATDYLNELLTVLEKELGADHYRTLYARKELEKAVNGSMDAGIAD
jgi:serine/threonine-protein kinase